MCKLLANYTFYIITNITEIKLSSTSTSKLLLSSSKTDSERGIYFSFKTVYLQKNNSNKF